MTNARPPEDRPRLRVVPCDLSEANAFVDQFHRHHEPVKFHFFSLAVADETDTVRGVAIIFKPAARMLCDGFSAEVCRLATDGCKNACSALYGAARRAAFALGYRRLYTYTLPSEGGASLRGAGWRLIGEAGGGSWDRPGCGRPRVDKHPTQGKLKWETTVSNDQIQAQSARPAAPKGGPG